MEGPGSNHHTHRLRRAWPSQAASTGFSKQVCALPPTRFFELSAFVLVRGRLPPLSQHQCLHSSRNSPLRVRTSSQSTPIQPIHNSGDSSSRRWRSRAKDRGMCYACFQALPSQLLQIFVAELAHSREAFQLVVQRMTMCTIDVLLDGSAMPPTPHRGRPL